MARVIIDNGFTLNVCPSLTLERLAIEQSLICLKGLTIQGFNRASMLVLEKMTSSYS